MTVEECAEAARTAWARKESDVRVLPGKNASYRILEANSGFPGSPSAPPRIEGCVWVGFEDSLRFVVPDTEAFLGHERWHALVFLGAQPLAFLIVGLLGRRMLPPRAASPGLLKIVLVGTVTGAGLTLLGLTVENVLALLGWTTSEQPWLNLLLADGFRSPWHIWLLLVVAAPVAEEMFFRGWVFENLRRHSGRTAGYVVSSLMFAAVHFNPSALPIYIVYSVGLAFAYERTGSVGACIVAHALLNVAALGLAG